VEHLVALLLIVADFVAQALNGGFEAQGCCWSVECHVSIGYVCLLFWRLVWAFYGVLFCIRSLFNCALENRSHTSKWRENIGSSETLLLAAEPSF
jgi:cytochrome b561